MSAVFANLASLEDLPRQKASEVKNKWADVVRMVHQQGSVAVTNHSTVEMVLLDAATYRRLTADLAVLKQREIGVLDELNQRFDAQLAVLQKNDASEKMDALFAARGRLRNRPKAGASF